MQTDTADLGELIAALPPQARPLIETALPEASGVLSAGNVNKLQ